MAMVFAHNTSFPKRYKEGAFVSFSGSWNRKPARGYEVTFVPFENGRPQTFETFLHGFLIDGGTAHFARPTGLVVASDGSLLLAEDGNGLIYRISYQKL